MKYEELTKLLYGYECDLLKSEVRKSAERIHNYLSDDYIEYTSSGKEYNYKNNDVSQDIDDNTELNWEIRDFTIKELADYCILALYKVIKHNGVDEKRKYTLRSSIWKYSNGKWKMVFHQGTPTSKF